MIRKALGIGAMLIAMYGCDSDPTVTEIKGPLATIEGNPLSVSSVISKDSKQGNGWSKLNIVIMQEGKEKPLLCTVCRTSQKFLEKVSEVEALVEAEVNDLDNDKITVTGSSGEKNRFYIDTVTVSGYTYKMNEDK